MTDLLFLDLFDGLIKAERDSISPPERYYFIKPHEAEHYVRTFVDKNNRKLDFAYTQKDKGIYELKLDSFFEDKHFVPVREIGMTIPSNEFEKLLHELEI